MDGRLPDGAPEHGRLVKEADIWNQCSKSNFERTIGKDAMFAAGQGKNERRDHAAARGGWSEPPLARLGARRERFFGALLRCDFLRSLDFLRDRLS